MSVHNKHVKDEVRSRLALLGKKHPRLALTGKLFTPKIVEEVTNQVAVALGYPELLTCRYVYGRSWPEYQETYYKGFPQDQLYKLVTLQKNRCAICNESGTTIFINGGPRHLILDCTAITGEVRGLLCKRCHTRLIVATRLTEVESSYLDSPTAPALLGCAYYLTR